MAVNTVTLFYSKFCPYSSAILQYIKSYHLYELFDAIICVDNRMNNGIKINLPNYVASVPTLITPEYDIPLIDSNVMIWLKNIVKNKLQKPKMNSCKYETKIKQNKMVPDPPDTSLTPFCIGTSYDNNEVMKRFELLKKERNNVSY